MHQMTALHMSSVICMPIVLLIAIAFKMIPFVMCYEVIKITVTTLKKDLKG